MARSGKGGGKKRCTKGKSCGATCISKAKVCIMETGKPISKSLTKAKSKIAGEGDHPFMKDFRRMFVAESTGLPPLLVPVGPYVNQSYGGTNSLTKNGLKALEEAEKMIAKGGKDKDKWERLKRLIEDQLSPLELKLPKNLFGR